MPSEIRRLMALPDLKRIAQARLPRNPIVLVHGLYGFAFRGPSFYRRVYWGEFLRHCRALGDVDIYVAQVPPTGSIRERARVLHEAIAASPDLRGRDITLVGHSMGGLDARYLVTHIRPTSYAVRAVMTLATPHRGSPFMQWCRQNIGIGSLEDGARADAADTAAAHLPLTLRGPLLSRGIKRGDDARAAPQNESALGVSGAIQKAAPTTGETRKTGITETGGITETAETAKTAKSISKSAENKMERLSGDAASTKKPPHGGQEYSRTSAWLQSLNFRSALSQIVENASIGSSNRGPHERRPHSSSTQSWISELLETFRDLPGSMAASLSHYLLETFDSPAYANLTPIFMNEYFNPVTPDMPGVRYFSVAGHTDHIPLTHPLWLPKLVVDGFEANVLAEGARVPAADRGNDGVVPVASAKWGQYMGVVPHCNHWDMRGTPALHDESLGVKALVDDAHRNDIWAAVYRRLGGFVRGRDALEHVRTPSSPAPAQEPQQDSASGQNVWGMWSLLSNKRAGPPAFDLERFCYAIMLKLHNEGF